MRPPLALMLLLVSLVSAMVRASAAARSIFRRAYSTDDEDGVRTSIIRLPESVAGRKAEPPHMACIPSATKRLITAMAVIQRR